MRFRLPNQGAQDLSGGIGNLFRSIAMAPLYEAEAADARAKADADLAWRGAQQRQADAATAQSRAHAALFGSQQQAVEDQRQRGTLGEILKNAALMNGVPTDLTPDLEHRIRTGSLPTQYQAPVDGMGPVAPVPSALSPENVARVMRSMGLTNQALTVGDKSVENIAKATGMYREQGLGDDVLAGRLAPAAVGEAQAAIKGSKRIDNIGESGSGFNIFTGQSVALDPRMQAIFGDKAASHIDADKARAVASKAAAASSYASADNSRVHAAKARQEMEMGGKGVLQQTDQGLLLVDPRTGSATPVAGPNGQPAGKPGSGTGGGYGAAADKQLAGIGSLGAAVDEYVKALDGFSVSDMVNPNKRAAMGTKYNNMMLQAKEAYGLGVLNGPDYEILQSVVKDPTKFSSVAVSNEALKGQATELKRMMVKTADAVRAAHSRQGGAPSRAMPAPGSVQDGYRFKGGDPGNSANWEPVR